jgi:cell division septation protein DedD
MESKTKHRILGIVVVAGLAIIAYPFIQGGNSTSIEEAQIKAPEFPDQAIQLADETTTTEIPIDSSAASGSQDAPSTPDTFTSTQPTPDQLTPNQNQSADDPASTTTNSSQPSDDQTTTNPSPSQNRDSGMGVSTVPGSTPAVNTPSVAVPPATTPAAPSAPIAAPSSAEAAPSSSSVVNEDATLTLTSAPTASDEADKPAVKAVSAKADTPKAKKVAASHKRSKKSVHSASNTQPALLSKLTTASAIHANRNKPLDNNGLVQLKKAAWVIQMGSFKQKPNAIKLVNSLRAQGYRAFIQHAVVASGENTRVFVGPEQQQAAARIVASELETKMKMRGIVISYKPFNL